MKRWRHSGKWGVVWEHHVISEEEQERESRDLQLEQQKRFESELLGCLPKSGRKVLCLFTKGEGLGKVFPIPFADGVHHFGRDREERHWDLITAWSIIEKIKDLIKERKMRAKTNE
jgi:hypothetical protein